MTYLILAIIVLAALSCVIAGLRVWITRGAIAHGTSYESKRKSEENLQELMQFANDQKRKGSQR